MNFKLGDKVTTLFYGEMQEAEIIRLPQYSTTVYWIRVLATGRKRIAMKENLKLVK